QAQKEKNQAAIKELTTVAPPYTGLTAIGTQRDWHLHYGGGLFHGAHRTDAFKYLGKIMFASPEYSQLDILKYFLGMFVTMKRVWPHFFELDLYSQAPDINVPVY